jgi:hypothetical protein
MREPAAVEIIFLHKFYSQNFGSIIQFGKVSKGFADEPTATQLKFSGLDVRDKKIKDAAFGKSSLSEDNSA